MTKWVNPLKVMPVYDPSDIRLFTEAEMRATAPETPWALSADQSAAPVKDKGLWGSFKGKLGARKV